MKNFIKFKLILVCLTFISNQSFSQIFKRKLVSSFENTGTAAFGMSAIDYNSDGLLDLFCVDLKGDERLFRNEGKEGFTRITKGIIATDTLNSFDAVWVDYNNDGNIDLFTCNVLSFGIKIRPGAQNFLFQNMGNGTFSKIENNVVSKDKGNSITGSFADYDNDGDVDLFVPDMGQNNYLYENNGDGSFTKVTKGDIVKDSSVSLCGSWADFDNDGDLDFVTADCVSSRNIYYENLGNSNRRIRIKLIGTVSNKSAIGAQVRIKAIINGKSVLQMREISASNGFRSISNDFRAHFGLGDADKIDSIHIRWPSGKTSTQKNINPNQFLTITE